MRKIDQTGVPDGWKRCGGLRGCGAIKPVSEFHKDKSRYDQLHTNCRSCTLAHLHDDFLARDPQARSAYWREHYLKTPRQVLRLAAANALRRLPTFNDPISGRCLYDIWLQQSGRCALSGIMMTWGSGKRMPMATSISIDRIDRRLGYSRNNVRLLCNAINNFRGTMSDAELLTMLAAFHNFQFGSPAHALLSEAA